MLLIPSAEEAYKRSNRDSVYKKAISLLGEEIHKSIKEKSCLASFTTDDEDFISTEKVKAGDGRVMDSLTEAFAQAISYLKKEGYSVSFCPKPDSGAIRVDISWERND